MRSLLDELPPRALFPAEMPRYPNLWFLVDPPLALREQYQYAVRLIVRILEEQLGLRDTFVQDIRNRNLVHMLAQPGEGSDFQARLWPLQRFDDPRDSSRGHGHQMHARFYVSPLVQAGRTRQTLSFRGQRRDFFLIPASVHYEVATEDPLHPYADFCPMCGITGEYDVSVDPESQDYCVKIHDPLGLELLLHGTIRGQAALDAAGDRVSCLAALRGPRSCVIDEATSSEGEPRRLALVAFFAGEAASRA